MEIKIQILLLFSLIFLSFDLEGADLYWVNGGGSWDDLSHWSTVSGGNATPVSLPRPEDNVIFDINSGFVDGDEVILDGQFGFCRDMDWRGLDKEVIFEGDGELKVYGSMWLSSELDFRYTNPLIFKSDTLGNEIQFSGNIIDNVRFDNENGGWIVIDSLKCKQLNFSAGELNTQSNSIEIEDRFSMLNRAARRLILSKSTIFMGEPGMVSTFHFDVTDDFEIDSDSASLVFLGEGTLLQGGSADLDTLNLKMLRAHEDLSLNINLNVDSLIFSPGHTYSIGSGRTVDFGANGSLIANGTCNQYINISSSQSDMAATFKKSVDTLQLKFVAIEGVEVEGGGVFKINDGIDLGRNFGWEIDEALPRELFWVGGKGNWIDSTFWSISSGSVGGECLPTPNDDIIFDSNSGFVDGDEVILDGQFGFCGNMDWRGIDKEVVFDGTGEMKIYGSMWLDSKLDFRYDNPLIFKSDTLDNEIQFSGNVVETLQFDNENGGWLVMDSLKCKQLNFSAGELNTQSNSIEIEDRFSMLNRAARRLILSKSTIFMGEPGMVSTFHFDVTDDFEIDSDSAFLVFLGEGTLLQGGSADLDTLNLKMLRAHEDLSLNINLNVDSLIFSPGHTYNIGSGRTVDFGENGTLIANGEPSEPIEITASQSGQNATFEKLSDSLCLDHILLSDIHTMGNAEFYAGINSSDLGNNSGWRFESCGLSPCFLNLGNDTTICNSDTLHLDAEISSGIYTWSTGDTLSTLSVTTSGEYAVTVSSNFCTISDTIFVEVQSNPAISLGTDKIICQGDSVIFNLPTIYSYDWNFGATSSNVSIFPDSNSLYVAEAIDSFGCSTLDTIFVELVAPPVIDLGQDRIICSNDLVSLSPTYNNANALLWSTGATSPSILVRPIDTTLYSISATNFGCTRSDSITIFVLPTPSTSIIGGNEICLGDSITISATGANDFFWSTGDTTVSITISPSTLTTYSVTVSDGICFGVEDTRITVYNPVSASVSPTQNICIGQVLTLSAFGGMEYLWSTGQTSSVINVAPTSTRDYTVEVRDGACSDTAIVSVLVDQIPIANAGNDIRICEGEIATLNASGMGTYSWSTGDVSSSISVSPPVSTQYVLEVQDGLCKSTDDVWVFVTPNPIAYAGNDIRICEGTQVPLTGIGGLNYLWNTGQPEATIFVAPTMTTEYILTAFNGQCSDQDSVIITVDQNVEADAGSDQIICEGESAFLLGLGGGAYLWNTGSSNQNITVNPLVSTDYFLTVRNGLCSDIDTVSVNVNQRPMADAGPDMKICDGEVVTLNAQGGGQYRWSTGASNSSINVSPTSSSSYSVTVTQNGCTDTDIVNVEVVPQPQADAGSDQIVCSGKPISLSAKGGTNFLWSNGVTQSDQTIFLNSSSTFFVVVSNDRCVDTAEVLIQVLQSPISNFNFATSCEENTIDFKNLSQIASGSSLSSFWDFSDGNTSTEPNPQHTFSSPGFYDVTLVMEATNGCIDTLKRQIDVPDFIESQSTVGDTTIFENDTLQFDINSNSFDNLISYYWQFGNGDESFSSNPVYAYELSGLYNLTLTTNDIFGCTFVDSVLVNVLPNTGLREDVVVFPNPNKGEFFISLDLTRTINLEIEIYNSLGQYVKNVAFGELSVGLHELDVQINEFPTGAYALRFLGDGEPLPIADKFRNGILQDKLLRFKNYLKIIKH